MDLMVRIFIKDRNNHFKTKDSGDPDLICMNSKEYIPKNRIYPVKLV